MILMETHLGPCGYAKIWVAGFQWVLDCAGGLYVYPNRAEARMHAYGAVERGRTPRTGQIQTHEEN
jgi:hypothetical protein